MIYIDPPFNSNRNYELFWGETKEKRSFEDRRESTKAYISGLTTEELEELLAQALIRIDTVDSLQNCGKLALFPEAKTHR